MIWVINWSILIISWNIDLNISLVSVCVCQHKILLYNGKEEIIDKLLMVNFRILVCIMNSNSSPDQVAVHNLNIILCEVVPLALLDKLQHSLNVLLPRADWMTEDLDTRCVSWNSFREPWICTWTFRLYDVFNFSTVSCNGGSWFDFLCQPTAKFNHFFVFSRGSDLTTTNVCHPWVRGWTNCKTI